MTGQKLSTTTAYPLSIAFYSDLFVLFNAKWPNRRVASRRFVLGNTDAAFTSAVTCGKSLSKITKIHLGPMRLSEFLVGNFGVVRKSESNGRGPTPTKRGRRRQTFGRGPDSMRPSIACR